MEKCSKLSLKDLNKYRTKDGFIDMDAFFRENDVEVQREMVGTKQREKDWLQLSDSRVLLKTENENIDDGKHTGSIYAELIVSKLAKQAGLDFAHSDIIIYKGKKGILSRDVKKKGESFKTLRDYIGDDDKVVPGYDDKTDIEFVYDNFFKALKQSGISNENIKSVITNFNKEIVFDIFCMSTDNHTENIGFIENIDEDGNKHIALAPLFDRENALSLDIDFDTMKKISKDILKTSTVANMQESKISVIPKQEQEDEELEFSDFLLGLKKQVNSSMSVDSESQEKLWELNIDYLTEYPNVEDYIENSCMKLDINKAIEDVQRDIGVKLPVEVVDMASNIFEERKQQISYYLGLDLTFDEIDQEKINTYDKEKNNDQYLF